MLLRGFKRDTRYRIGNWNVLNGFLLSSTRFVNDRTLFLVVFGDQHQSSKQAVSEPSCQINDQIPPHTWDSKRSERVSRCKEISARK